MRRILLLSILFCSTSIFAQVAADWLLLAGKPDAQIIGTLQNSVKATTPFLLDNADERAKAEQIETDVRQKIQSEEQTWQKQFETVFATVAEAYSQKLNQEARLKITSDDILRLKTSLENLVKQIVTQEQLILTSERQKENMLRELGDKLKTIPFYVVYFGGCDYITTGRTPKDVEKAIFQATRTKAIEEVNGLYINSETQVVQYQLIKDRITSILSGRLQVENTTDRPFIKAISGTSNRVAVVGLLAVYPWDAEPSPPVSPTWLQQSSMEIFVIDNATLSKLNTYPSTFVKDAQTFLEKAKTQNLTYKSQLRSMLMDTRTRLEQETQHMLEAQEILTRLQNEQNFYKMELEKRQSEKNRLESDMNPVQQKYIMANKNYRNFLSTRTIYQFQTDFQLDEYTASPEQVYASLVKACFDRFKTNIREEFLSWVTIVDFYQLTEFRETRREIPATIESVKILYPYVQNNLEGRPTRGLILVFKAKFLMDQIPDYSPIKSNIASTTQYTDMKDDGITLASSTPGPLQTKPQSTVVIDPKNKFDISSETKETKKVSNSENLNNIQMGIEWVLVKGNTFEMGDSFGDGEDNEKPIHKISLSDFYMSKTEITVAQYSVFCKATGRSMPSSPSWNWQDKHPIVNVSWYDAVAYCQWAGCSLPTEAQWEYAAREAGKMMKWSGVSREYQLKDYAWYDINSGSKTHTVATQLANGLGLYDMSGNVGEWCQDWYDEKYYQNSPQVNPQGPTTGEYRVLRGGSWSSSAALTHVTDRRRGDPNSKSDSRGFRVVRTIQ